MTTLPQLERFIPLSQAARQIGLNEETLRLLIDSGRLKGIVLPNGDVGVSEPELGQLVMREQFEHLRGQAITIAQAADAYQIHPETIRGWVKRSYIGVLREGYGKELDQADVEYCVATYRAQGATRGKRLFNERGDPYEMQKPEWAAYQRERRKKNQANPVTTKRPRT